MKEFNLNHFAPAIVWWLNYISAVGRDYIIGESSIKIPATEYLERSDVSDIELEFNHPKLSLKRFDLFFKNKVNNKKVAFEFKYVKEDSTRSKDEKQRIFNDLVRLFLFVNSSKKGYFLICGNQMHFKSSFESLKIRKPSTKRIPKTKKTATKSNKTFYTEWFSFDIANPIQEIDLQKKTRTYSSIYKNFISSYNDAYKEKTNSRSNLKLPATIRTKLVFLSQELNENNIPQTLKIGIWEVKT